MRTTKLCAQKERASPQADRLRRYPEEENSYCPIIIGRKEKDMKKRLFGVAVIMMVVFTLSCTAFAIDTYTVGVNEETIPEGTVGTQYAGISFYCIKGRNDVAGAHYELLADSGSLPDGLSLGESDGKITGTPTKAGTFKFKVTGYTLSGRTTTGSGDSDEVTIVIKAAAGGGGGGGTTTPTSKLTKPTISTNKIAFATGDGKGSEVAIAYTGGTGGLDPTTLTWNLLDAGKLTDMSLSFDAEEGKVFVVDDAKASKGETTIKVTLTAKDAEKTQVSSTKSIKVTVSGLAPEYSTENFATKDKDIGSFVHGEEIDDDEEKLIIVTIKGTKDITVTKGTLPTGLEWKESEDTDPNNDATGIYSYILSGTVDEKAEAKKYNVAFEASNEEKSGAKKSFTLTVLPLPTIDETVKPGAITWGKSYTFAPKSAAKDATWTIAEDSETTAADLSSIGLKLDKNTGKLTGPWNKNPYSDDAGAYAVNFGNDDKTVTKKITLVATSKVAHNTSDDADFELTFNLPVPTIKTTKDAATKALTLEYNKEISKETPVVIEATGYGKLEWDETNIKAALPAGLEVETSDDAYLLIYGTPTATMKSTAIDLTVKNAAGSVKISPKVEVSVKALSIDLPYTLPSGDLDVDDNINVTYKVTPGPITWKAKGLPAGVTLETNDDGTEAKLTGDMTTATKKETEYTLTATHNTYKSAKIELKAKYNVYALPELSTTTLPAMTAGKDYKAKVTFKNNPSKSAIEFSEDGLSAAPAKTNDFSTLQITGKVDKLPTQNDGTVIATITAGNHAGDIEPVQIPIVVKAVAPKFTTAKLKDFVNSEGDERVIETTGTQPITFTATIAAADAKKAGINDGEAITLTAEANDSGFTATTVGEEVDSNTVYLVFAGGKVAYKNLPITFTAENAGGKATKKYSVNVTGADPKWYYTTTASDSDEEDGEGDELTAAPTTLTIPAVAGEVIPETYTFTISGDDPINVAYTTTTVNGLAITDNGNKTYTLAGTPTADKETKSAFTLTAQNTSTGKKAAVKVTVQAKLAPSITNGDKDNPIKKESEVGKSLSLKPAAKGSKTITWLLKKTADAEGEDAADDLKNDYGLNFDKAKGTISGTATKPTLGGEDGGYGPVTYYVIASNDVDHSEPVPVEIGIRGQTPKLATKAITIDKEDEEFDWATSKYQLATQIATTVDSDTADVTYAPADETETAKLTALGIEGPESDANLGTFAGDQAALKATKGSAVKFTASNYGSSSTGSVKFTVLEVTPELEASDSSVTLAPTKTTAAEATLTFTSSVTENLKWSISEKPKTVKAKLTVGENGTATVTLTAAKGLKNDVETTMKVTVTETISKRSATSDTIDISASAAPDDDGALPDELAALPDDGTEAIAEDGALPENGTAGTGAITFGAVRTEDDLTAEQKAYLAEAGYVVVSVLPETNVAESDTYDVVAELSEQAVEGAELAYFAFPVDAEATEDDKIVNFYDEDGAEIDAVPESKTIVVSPWFEAGKTYKPVIAVKTDNATGAKDNAEDLKEGDVITEKAVEAK